MNEAYRTFYGMAKEPFGTDLAVGEILETEELRGVKERFDYAMRLGAVGVVTGDIGSGKSTALRYASEKLHPSGYRTLYVTATTGSILELYRLILAELGMETAGISRAMMAGRIKKEVRELAEDKKMKVVLVVDEASLLGVSVFAELHTLCQFDKDSRTYLPMILAGQNNLIDKLMYRDSQPLASRVVARGHLEGIDRKAMDAYLKHHLNIAGVKENVFDETAVTAIHQGSGGLLRKSNHLARGALIAAAKDKCAIVTADHVRLAATEIF